MHYPRMNRILEVKLGPGRCLQNCDTFKTYILPDLPAASRLVIDDEWHVKADMYSPHVQLLPGHCDKGFCWSCEHILRDAAL